MNERDELLSLNGICAFFLNRKGAKDAKKSKVKFRELLALIFSTLLYSSRTSVRDEAHNSQWVKVPPW